jgi:hypothetical protein
MAKTTTPKEGIFLKRNARGFYITIKENGDKLCALTGYNTRRNATKGVAALRRALNKAFSGDLCQITDLTKPVKRKK